MTVHELLRTQDGLITREQALRAGLTKKAIEVRVARGEWVRVRPAVFLSAAHPFTARARLRAEVLWLGPDATVVGLGAAWWWRMVDGPPLTLRIAMPAGRRGSRRPGVLVETSAVTRGERVVIDGLAVTSRALTVVDAARELPLPAGADLMDRALLRGRVTLDQLRAAYGGSLGRAGSGKVARLLGLAAGGARFAAERRLHRLLRDAGVDGWLANLPVEVDGYGDALLDLAFPECRVLVEVDGWAYHRDLDAFRRDHRRQNALVLAGWTVLRVTWHELVNDPERVLAEILAAVHRDHRDVPLRPVS